MTAFKSTKKESPDRAPFSKNLPPSSELQSKERRTVIRKLALSTAALAGCSLIPDKWTTPIIEFGALPAHATTSGTSQAAAAAAEPAPATACPNDFNLVFLMTYQSCDACGIWFDSAELVVVHSEGIYRHSQSGSLLITATVKCSCVWAH